MNSDDVVIPQPGTFMYDVLKERVKQIHKHGFDAKHDDELLDEQLGSAGDCYVDHARLNSYWWNNDENIEEKDLKDYLAAKPPADWPALMDEKYWKPEGPRMDMIKGLALLIAEGERLDRLIASMITLEDNKCDTCKTKPDICSAGPGDIVRGGDTGGNIVFCKVYVAQE